MASRRETKIIERVQSRVASSKELCADYHKRAHTNGTFVSPLTTSWSAEDVRHMNDMGAPTLDLPYCRLFLASMSGKEILDRLRPVPHALEDGDEEWVERLSYYSRWDRSNQASRVESQAFRDALNCGVGIVSSITDLNQWIPKTRWSRESIFHSYWDANSVDPNFDDRTWCMTSRKLTYDQFKIMFPNYFDKVKKSPAKSILDDTGGYGMTQGNSRPFIYRGGHKPKKDYDVELIHYQEKTTKEMILADFGDYYEYYLPETFVKKFARLEEGRLVFEGINDWKPIFRESYFYRLIANGVLIKDAPIPENCFTINFITGFRAENRDYTKYHGITDLNKDLQKLLDKFASNWIYYFATQPKNTYLANPADFDNIAEAEGKLARGGILLKNTPGGLDALQKGDYPDMQGGMDVVRRLLYDVSGLDPYSMGQVGTTGSLSRTSSRSITQVSQAGTTLIAEPFDSYGKHREDSLKNQFRKMKGYLTEEQLGKIIGNKLTYAQTESGVQFVIPPKSTWGRVLDCDITMDLAPSSSSEKHDLWQSLVQTNSVELIMSVMPDLLPDLIPSLPASKREEMRRRLLVQQQNQSESPDDTQEEM